MNSEKIIEKKLHIPPDYQYRAIRSKFWPQRNWHRNKFVVLKKVLRFKKGDDVLDLGTGSGNFELSFSRQVKSVVGVDYNDEALNFLSAKITKMGITNVTLVQADIRRLPTKVTNKKYDKIIIIDTIEHIEVRDATKVIGQLYQSLKRGGQLFIITPNYKSPWILLEGLLDRFTPLPKLSGQQHLAKFDKANLWQILMNCGFTRLEFSSFNSFLYLLPSGVLNHLLIDAERKMSGSHGCLIAVLATKD